MSKKLTLVSVLPLVLILLTALFRLPAAAQEAPPVAETTPRATAVEEGEHETLVSPAAPRARVAYVPPGWTVLDNAGTGGAWNTNDTFGEINRITYSGTVASGLSMAAQAAGSGIIWDTEIWSPPIDLTGATTATVEFESNFQDYTENGDAYVDVSTNGGGSWTNIHHQTTDDPSGGELEALSLDAYTGHTIHLRWHYTVTASTAWYWHIDNVHVHDAGTTYLFEDFEPPAAPDLTGSQKLAPFTVQAGQPITYQIVISNSGAAPALNAIMTDTLPAAYVPGSLSCTGGSCWEDGTAVYWSGSVPTGTLVTVVFAVDSSAVGCGNAVTNTAVLSDPQALAPAVVQVRTELVGKTYYNWTFEAHNGGFLANTPPGAWAWGDLVPSIDSPPAAHSGTRLWATNLAGDIPTEPSHHYLTRTVTLPDDLTGLSLQWWDWLDEDGLDKGYVYINSITNTLYFIDIDQLSWQHHAVDLSPWAGQTVDIVFYYSSGGSLSGGAGWYVDDVTIHGGCEEVRLTPLHQVGRACPGGVATYTLRLANETLQPNTFDVLVSDNTWDTQVDPPSLTLPSGGSETITAYVAVPCQAAVGDQDLATIVAQSTAFSATAELETEAPLGSRWEDRALAPGDGARYPAVVYWDGNLYQMGGENPNAVTDTFRYEIATDSWYTMTGMITPVTRMDGAAIDGSIYVPGGQDPGADYTRWLQIYDTTTDSWSAGAPLPYPVRQHEVVALNGLLYVLGGQSNGTYTNAVLTYDPGTDAWTYAPSMQKARASAASGVIGGKIYVAGGYNGSFPDSVEVFDPLAGTWSYVADMPTPWVMAADGVLHDRFLLVTGGYWSNNTASDLGRVYDATTDRWMELPHQNHLRYGAEGDGDGSVYHMIAGRHYDETFYYSRLNETLILCPDYSILYLPLITRND
jgi:uncharacterized repeat protein (TIGR01451 family)